MSICLPSGKSPKNDPRCLAAALFLLAAIQLRAGPLMVTDDPGTPLRGRWEINLLASVEQTADERTYTAPLLDLSYGLSERVGLKYEAGLITVAGVHPRLSGIGNSRLGLKWRFHENTETHLAASFHPQAEFDTPGTSSREKGLVSPGHSLLLPFQVQYDFASFGLVAEVGYVFASQNVEEWMGGLAILGSLSKRIEMALEVNGFGATCSDYYQICINLATSVDVSDRRSLLFSVGRELFTRIEPVVDLTATIGVQIRY